MGSRAALGCANESPEDCVGVLFLAYPLHRPGDLKNLRDQPLYELCRPGTHWHLKLTSFASFGDFFSFIQPFLSQAQMTQCAIFPFCMKHSQSRNEKTSTPQSSTLSTAAIIHLKSKEARQQMRKLPMQFSKSVWTGAARFLALLHLMLIWRHWQIRIQKYRHRMTRRGRGLMILNREPLPARKSPRPSNHSSPSKRRLPRIRQRKSNGTWATNQIPAVFQPRAHW